MALVPSSTIINEPLVTAEPSIVVVALPVEVVIVNEGLPKLVNVSLPNVSELAVVCARVIASIENNLESSGAVSVIASVLVKARVSVPAPPSTVSTPPETWNSPLLSTSMVSLPAPPSMLSRPVPPVIISLPAPPEIVSFPPSPLSTSAPPLPDTLSAPAPAAIISAPSPPFTVSLRP